MKNNKIKIVGHTFGKRIYNVYQDNQNQNILYVKIKGKKYLIC